MSASSLLTPRDFRNALGQFATGVTVVTTVDASGQPHGLTVSSFNAVSLTPPLVLWSLADTSASMALFTQCSHYAIHVLSAEQQALAMRFATRGIDRFAQTPWQPNAQGVPLIEGAAAVFECRNRSRYEEGDHTIFVGEVERCGYALGAVPLIYHGGLMHTAHGVPASQ